MNKLKEIQKEAYIFLRSNWTTDQKQIDFIDSLITKAYEAGKKETVEAISRKEGWEDSQKYYEGKLLNKE